MDALPLPLLAYSMPFGDTRRVKEERARIAKGRASGIREPVEAQGCGHRAGWESVLW